MSTFPTALFDFISSNEDGAGYFNLAKDTFFEEVLDAYHLKVAGDISALLEKNLKYYLNVWLITIVQIAIHIQG